MRAGAVAAGLAVVVVVQCAVRAGVRGEDDAGCGRDRGSCAWRQARLAAAVVAAGTSGALRRRVAGGGTAFGVGVGVVGGRRLGLGTKTCVL